MLETPFLTSPAPPLQILYPGGKRSGFAPLNGEFLEILVLPVDDPEPWALILFWIYADLPSVSPELIAKLAHHSPLA